MSRLHGVNNSWAAAGSSAMIYKNFLPSVLVGCLIDGIG